MFVLVVLYLVWISVYVINFLLIIIFFDRWGGGRICVDSFIFRLCGNIFIDFFSGIKFFYFFFEFVLSFGSYGGRVDRDGGSGCSSICWVVGEDIVIEFFLLYLFW